MTSQTIRCPSTTMPHEPAYKFRLYCTRCDSWDHTKLVQGNDRMLLWCERCQTFAKHLDEEHGWPGDE